MLLNDLNSNDIMSEVIKNVNNIELDWVKKNCQNHFFLICTHLHVVFQSAMSVDRHIGSELC